MSYDYTKLAEIDTSFENLKTKAKALTDVRVTVNEHSINIVKQISQTSSKLVAIEHQIDGTIVVSRADLVVDPNILNNDLTDLFPHA